MRLAELVKLAAWRKAHGVVLNKASWLFAIAATLGAADEGPVIKSGHKSRPYRWRGLTYPSMLGSLINCGIAGNEDEIMAIIKTVGRTEGPRKWMGPQALGVLLDLMRVERSDCCITSIEAVDEAVEERRARIASLRKEKDRKSKRAKRAKMPREQWRAASLSAQEPWVIEGICRRTWERRRAKKRLAQGEAEDAQGAVKVDVARRLLLLT